MKKFCVATLFAGALIFSPGCGGDGGGNIMENADQSDVDKYLADQEAMDKEMQAMEAAQKDAEEE